MPLPSAWLSSLLVAALVWRLLSRRTVPSILSRVRGPEKEHWLTGNLHRLFRDAYDYTFHLIDSYGGVLKIYGVLGSQQLFVSDPRALHHVVVKDQDIYHESEMFLKTNQLLFGEGLISTDGEQHRKQRKMLNPVFSLANMRELLPTIQPIADELLRGIMTEVPPDGGAKEVDLHPWMGRGTIEYVGQAVLGISFGALDPQNSNEYVDAIRNVAHVGLKIIFLRPMVPWVVRKLSPFWRNKLVDWLPLPPLRQIREMCYTMERHSKKILEEKREAMEQGRASERRDLMTIMLEANVSTSEEERLTDVELTGQINTMLLGGQETSTSALSRILWILSRDQPAQARLRSEIRAAKLAHAAASGHDGPWESVHLPYDTLMALPYLDAVLRETLRVHPPTNMINRTCTRDAILPVEFPLTDASGEEVKAVHVPAGTNIVISILGANHNKQVWGDDADVWRPERWLTASGERIGLTEGRSVDMMLGQAADEGDKSAVDGTPGYKAGVKYPGVYATMMTFLGGGRACIGFKFAEMEIKQVITTFLSRLHFSLPSAVDKNGVRKEIYWRIDGLQIPVVREPHGDFKTPQVPLDVRVVRDSDYL
ncbi:cytochrome P450 [Epithele typhae]|uniref:cytochrome P450 n=1 Tax=Epithele typhae TaxID=378194 RepID=UPI002008EB5C|nr:cytochrome P450 [Epithele typhae]KAH9941748.1 cytochrome P450 [Epithele typhae]